MQPNDPNTDLIPEVMADSAPVMVDVPTIETDGGAPAVPVAEDGIDEIDLSSVVPVPALNEGDDSQQPVAEDATQSSFQWPAPTPINNATISSEYAKDIGDQWDDLATTIALPADTAARTMNYGETNPHADAQVDSEAGEKWAETISVGLNNGSFHDNLLPAARREGANYQQKITPEGGRSLAIAAPRFADDEGPLLTGERAMLRVNALMGRGAIIQVPLWHSGFWITLKSPGEIELLDALQHISDNKIEFGRSTNGLAFANHVVVSNSAIVDLAMRNLYETTVAGFNTTEKIRGAINCLDIPMLAWGLACAVYPKGFQFERALLDKQGVATTVVQQLLNVGTCQYTDRNSLNDWQVAHMSQRATGSMKESALAMYRDHFTRGKPKLVMLDAEIGIELKVPSVDQFLNAGQRWVDELVVSVSQAFAQDMSDKQRNDMIYDRAKATSMRQYVHWINAIEIPRLGKRIVDLPTLELTISHMSGDNTVRNKFYEVVQSFINDSIISLIGVPQVHPEEASQVVPRFENIIPIDPIAVFFSLLYQKIQQIRRRP
jgi:hypothetical protein